MLTSVFGSRHLRLGNGYLRLPRFLDRFRLFARYLFFYTKTIPILLPKYRRHFAYRINKIRRLLALCHLNCGPHGSCDRGRCSCEAGWTGEKCDQLPYDPRCSQHGQCKNGTCICSRGWNGQHCTIGNKTIRANFYINNRKFKQLPLFFSCLSLIAGCPQNCHGNGRCYSEDGEYRCECELGWAGYDCSIQLETNCSDEVDNDHGNISLDFSTISKLKTLRCSWLRNPIKVCFLSCL